MTRTFPKIKLKIVSGKKQRVYTDSRSIQEDSVKHTRSDNGGEYISIEFPNICSDSGINIQHYVPYTPQQNGVAERKNHSLKEMTTCMLEEKGLDANLWDEVMNVSAHIPNRVPHSFIKGNTPFKSYFGHKMDVSNFKFFGSTAWARILLDKRKSLQPQSIE